MKPHVTTRIKNTEEKIIVSYLDIFFKTHLAELMVSNNSNKWFRDTFNIALILIDIFCECGIVIKKENVYNKILNDDPKSNVILWLKHTLDNNIPFSNHLPDIVPPKRICTKRDVENIMSSFKKGIFRISPSKLTLKILNLAQKKTFKVNNIYKSVLDYVYTSNVNLT